MLACRECEGFLSATGIVMTGATVARIIDALVARAANMTQAEVPTAAGEDALYWIDQASRDGDEGVRHRVCCAPAAEVDC